MKISCSIILLIIFTSISSAQDWHWQRNDDLLNPSGIKTKGMNTPFTGDFDDDGDIDLIVGCKGAVVQYYENIGSPDSAIWLMSEDYFATLDLDTSYAPRPSLVDLDGDGLDELYISRQDNGGGYSFNGIQEFENTGTLEIPVWEENVFDMGYNIDDIIFHQFIDYDGDGDVDIVGFSDGLQLFENIGDAENPDFELNETIFESLDWWVGSESKIAMVNLAGDDKLELISIPHEMPDAYDLTFVEYYVNSGTEENPDWEYDGELIHAGYCSNAHFFDADNDGDSDMLIGNHWVPLFYNENLGSSAYYEFVDIFNGRQIGPMYYYHADNICFVDYDNDNDHDFICFYSWWQWPMEYDYLSWESAANIGDLTAPRYDFTRNFLPWIGYPPYTDKTFSSGDLNGDNFPELAINNTTPAYYINDNGTGYSGTAVFEIDNFNFNQYPELADFNGDGLTDLLIRTRDSLEWMFYKNVGDPNIPAWLRMPQWRENIDIPIFQFRAAKIDHDDRIDLVGIDENQQMHGFINVGSDDDISFTYLQEIFEGWDTYSVRYYDCADLDGDGDDDIVVDSSGVINFIENMTPVDITETKRNLPDGVSLSQNYPNPFNGSTNISFTLENNSHIKLTIFDILGREIISLADETLNAGEHTITWNAASNLSSGIYFYRLKTDERISSKQMVYIK
ncbi:MAG: T9SS type A sorting domain-containing protein [candidate division Zixibacteria bacterium]|nr:T9SS type A sorting domain-containing protein [candidate division Zixibacteria bacterium]